MNIDLDILNRIGIILNFLAGFMLAPDLIGRERLLTFEHYLENKIQITIKYVKDTSKNIYIKNDNETILDVALMIIQIIFIFYIIHSVLSNTRYMFIYFLTVIIDAILVRLLVLSRKHPRRTRLFLITTLRKVLKIINRIEKFIRQENTVISLLTFWGIIFFIVGNLFQLIASFK